MLARTTVLATDVSPSLSPPAASIALDRPRRVPAHTRLFAGLMLVAVAALLILGARTVYHVLNDSFVAPAILSPDSDIVMANKLKLSELRVEHTRAMAECDGIDGDLIAADQAIARLQSLQQSATNALAWTSHFTSRKASTNSAELAALAEQKRVIEGMLGEQRQLAKKAQSDVDSGLISRTEFAKEMQTVKQMELALLENQRAALQSAATMQETTLAQHALTRHSGALTSPEQLTREEQMIRVELDLVRLQSEKRSKAAQRGAISERLATIDELEAQLRGRPISQATSRSLDVAFVPYTQLAGVTAGAEVYSCVWGLFFCHNVGHVAQLVPGEVILPDPWGSQARGQYAVLDLHEHEAAKAKVLRVRSEGAVAWTPLATVSAR